MKYREFSKKSLKIGDNRLFAIVLILVVSLSQGSCINRGNKPNVLNSLRNEYGGNWSVSSKEGCVLLSVTGSERLNLHLDSIDYFLDEIELITEDFKTDNCLDLEHKIVFQRGVFQQEQSRIYIIREKASDNSSHR